MLADPAALRAVCDGDEGILSSIERDAVFVELSTVGVEPLVPLRAALLARGAALVDAPVSGSRVPAEEGALVVLAGGPCDAIARVTPVLSAFGVVRRTGPSGSGAATKLVFNQLGAHMLAGLASAVVLGVRLGLDARELLASIDHGAFRSPMYANKGARMIEGRFEPSDFSVELLLKDQELVLAAARSVGVELPTLEAVRAVIARAVAQGEGAKDMSAIVLVLERMCAALASEPRATLSARATDDPPPR
jgi:3-hydroxyisobutyrate dehydrogenase-like beta-hydroxyacid dehydrogenase